MGTFIKTFDVRDTQVAVYKDTMVMNNRTKFVHVVVAVTEMPHAADKKIFAENLLMSQIECSDKAEQEVIFNKYSIEDAARLVDNVRAKYKQTMQQKSNILLPGDMNFKMPIER